MSESGRAFFEIPELWEHYASNQYMAEKIRTLRSLIPARTQRLVDLGCGNGMITNELSKDHKVVAVDYSWTALAYVDADRVNASATALPFRAGSIDLLLCSEMLEHLEEGDFRRTVQEILRLDAPHLLLTIPHRENIHLNEIKCVSCGHVFNASHHYRSFSVEYVESLFPGYATVESRVGGPPVRDYPPPLLRLRQRVGNRWYQLPAGRPAICLRCGNKEFPRSRHNPVSFFCDGLNKILSRRRPYWLYVLLRKAL